MKNKLIPACFLLGLTCALHAQSTPLKKTNSLQRASYTAWIWNFDKPIFAAHAHGLAEINIPYSVKELSSGITTQKTASFNLKNWYTPAPSAMIDILGLEFGGKKQFFDLRMGLLYNFNPQITPRACVGFYEFIGYGRHYPFSPALPKRGWENNGGKNYHTTPGNSLWISPSVDFYFYLNTLSLTQTIQNANSEVCLPGITAHAQFTVPKSNNSNNTNSNAGKTSQATDLGLDFINSGCGLAPRLAIGNAPTKRFAWRLNFSLLIPFYQEARISVEQHGSQGNQGLGNINLNAPVNTLYNGHEVRRFPFSLNGFIIGFSLGIYQGTLQEMRKTF